jgi:hypothetical protein
MLESNIRRVKAGVNLVIFSSGSRLSFDPDYHKGSEPSPFGRTILGKTKDSLNFPL